MAKIPAKAAKKKSHPGYFRWRACAASHTSPNLPNSQPAPGPRGFALAIENLTLLLVITADKYKTRKSLTAREAYAQLFAFFSSARLMLVGSSTIHLHPSLTTWPCLVGYIAGIAATRQQDFNTPVIRHPSSVIRQGHHTDKSIASHRITLPKYYRQFLRPWYSNNRISWKTWHACQGSNSSSF